jgi:hypothetical protein
MKSNSRTDMLLITYICTIIFQTYLVFFEKTLKHVAYFSYGVFHFNIDFILLSHLSVERIWKQNPILLYSFLYKIYNIVNNLKYIFMFLIVYISSIFFCIYPGVIVKQKQSLN